VRYITLSWDDGFRASSLKTAALFERYVLRAEFNAVATYGVRDPVTFGDFALWNELQARGHVIQPHGWDHTNKASVPFDQARDLILRCLDRFAAELSGFEAQRAIFNFPYNASTPELEAWVPSVVRAFRTGHGPTINPLPRPDTVKLTTSGWQEAEAWLDRCLKDFLAREEGCWLIYNTHGMDGEGWGPLSSGYLERLLDRLVQTDNLMVLPARDVLAREAGSEFPMRTAQENLS